jgi:hypothetical protein
MTTANEIDLTANANRYTLGIALVKRLISLMKKTFNIDNKDDEDMVIQAMNYAHSVTKSQMRGAK